MKMIRDYIMPAAHRDAISILARLGKGYCIDYDETFSARCLTMYAPDGERHAVLWIELDEDLPTWHTVLVKARHVSKRIDVEGLTLAESIFWALDLEPHVG
jgi:hypothetical protein